MQIHQGSIFLNALKYINSLPSTPVYSGFGYDFCTGINKGHETKQHKTSTLPGECTDALLRESRRYTNVAAMIDIIIETT